jgi:dipeptidyl-peptidase-4
MRRSILLLSALAALALTAFSQAAPAALTVEAIFSHGPLVPDPPPQLSWSPDGKRLIYEDDGDLLELPAAPAERSRKPQVLVSRATLAAIAGTKDSEQDRDHRERYKMAAFLWAPDAAHLLFDGNGQLWLYDLNNGTGVQVATTGAASGDDPKFSPNGEYVSFIRDHGLNVARIAGQHIPSLVQGSGPEIPVTTIAPAADANTLNGEVDWVYKEELEVRSNYFWSPDSKHLAFLQMNESAVPEYPLTDWIPTHATVENQRYPQPGDPNPTVRVGVVGIEGGQMVWVTLPIQAGQDYIPRFGWADAQTLWIEVLSRDHQHRDLYFADAASGRARPALQLRDDKFFNDQYDVAVGDGSIVLTQWNDGHNHLYLYSYDRSHPGAAQMERQLTQGDFEVGEVYRVDFSTRKIYFASSESTSLEKASLDQQLWQVDFGGVRRQLSAGPGHHEGTFAPLGEAFIDKFSTRLDPPALRLCAAGKCNTFWQTHTLEPYRLRPPQQFTVKAHDGTPLYATLLLPAGAKAGIPLIVNPYGGPGEQTVANQWSNGLLFDNVLAQHGFAVLHTDNRGMGNRGRAFAQAAYRNFGPVQLEDQLTVLDAVLAQYAQLDPQRLGWWGWSWGGTFTLYALSHSDRFRAGVAVAPVTDWRNYDSIYTERYMSLPAGFASGYRDFSVVNSAEKLKGRLLLVHGTGDDNVHLENSVQFVQKLIEAQIPYDLQIYPRKTHSIAGPEVRTHLFNRILAHFEENLRPEVEK